MTKTSAFCSGWPMFLAIVVLTISGCGQPAPRSSPVTGKVTLQGKPITAASIRFCNQQAAIDILARLDADGRYAVAMARGTGLPEGTYQVAILPGGKSSPVGSFGKKAPSNPSMIPPKYRQPATSGLTLTVKSEPCVFDVDMQSR